jgi:hypothetical protein
MNLIQMICCALISKASELGQTYLSNKVQTINVRRAQTVDDANNFINSAVQELGTASNDFCKCELMPSATMPTPTTEATSAARRMFWQNNKKK